MFQLESCCSRRLLLPSSLAAVTQCVGSRVADCTAPQLQFTAKNSACCHY
jgi:hypothetical protein